MLTCSSQMVSGALRALSLDSSGLGVTVDSFVQLCEKQLPKTCSIVRAGLYGLDGMP